MAYIRNHWYHIGGIILVILAAWLLIIPPNLSTIQHLLIFNFMALLAHQFEEYQLPGGAPSIINRVVYDEKELADRYPGNTLSIMLVNTIAWSIYIIAILFPNVIWLGLGTILFSLFQLLGHGFQMNIKLKTWYNPGLATTIFLFVPLGIYFINYATSHHLLNGMDWFLGIMVLILCIGLSIVAPVQLLKNKNTSYIISDWQLEQYEKIVKFAKIGPNRPK